MNFSNSHKLLNYALSHKWYTSLINQLIKDFNRANVAINFSKELSPKELKSILHEKIYFLHMEKFTDYLNLMYAVDIPEHQFKNINSSNIVEVAEEVTFLVLKRELQKVMLKSKYS